MYNEAPSGRPSVFTFVTKGDSLLMSFVKFSLMFRDLFFTRLSQFSSHTEKFVPDGSRNAHR